MDNQAVEETDNLENIGPITNENIKRSVSVKSRGKSVGSLIHKRRPLSVKVPPKVVLELNESYQTDEPENENENEAEGGSWPKKEDISLAMVPFGKDYLQMIKDNPVTDNNWPKDIKSHAKRRFFTLTQDNSKLCTGEGVYHKEADDHCIFCGSNENTDLLSCRGFMDGFISKKMKIKCKSVFHLSCILEYNASDYNATYIALPECQNDILCPLHFCDTCFFERRKQRCFGGKLIECALCLRAFHYDQCGPIGGKDLELSLDIGDNVKYKIEMVICSAHRPEVKVKQDAHLAICCECEEGTKKPLIKCRICIRSFHGKCRTSKTIDGQLVPADLCESCLTGECIRFDSPVMARWRDNKFYPAFTRDWSKCPMALRKSDKYDQLGHLVVQWLGDGNTFSIITVADCVSIFESSLRVCGRKATKTDALDWQEMIDRSEEYVEFRPLLKEVRRKIETSRYMSREAEKRGCYNVPDKYVCDCPKNAKNRCSTEECSNKREFYECPPECHNEGQCHNRGISEKIVNPKIERRATQQKGFGVFAVDDIKEGEFIAEYAGEIIDAKETKRRMDIVSNARDREANLYMMQLGQGLSVDAARAGNIARYINHSCDPNCDTVKRSIFVKERKNDTVYVSRIAVVAKKDIKINEELSFTYRMDDMMNMQAPECKCGAENCNGRLGDTGKQEELEDEQSSNSKGKRKTNAKKGSKRKIGVKNGNRRAPPKKKIKTEVKAEIADMQIVPVEKEKNVFEYNSEHFSSVEMQTTEQLFNNQSTSSSVLAMNSFIMPTKEVVALMDTNETVQYASTLKIEEITEEESVKIEQLAQMNESSGAIDRNEENVRTPGRRRSGRLAQSPSPNYYQTIKKGRRKSKPVE